MNKIIIFYIIIINWISWIINIHNNCKYWNIILYKSLGKMKQVEKDIDEPKHH